MKKLPILGGVIGAVLGFVAAVLLFELLGPDGRADPIATGLFALLGIGPAGAIAGAMLGTYLFTRAPVQDAGADGATSAAGTGRNTFKALAIVVALAAIGGGAYYAYAVATATPWINPNGTNPVLQFEVRFPAGPTPAANDIKVELQTDQNRMPGEVVPSYFRREGEWPVIFGNVEMAYRTPNRQLEIKIAGQPTRVYRIGLAAKAPHADEFSMWQALGDGTQIRYRAKWQGR